MSRWARLLVCLVLLALTGAPTRAGIQDPALEGSMNGQVVLITGSTDGLGREVARRVAARGAHVIVHGRNQERGHALVKEIAAMGKGGARFYAADFSSLAAVRAFAQTIQRTIVR